MEIKDFCQNKQEEGHISTSSPLWRVFLDSKCSSATVFFKLHLSTRSYFHSPTPWTNPRYIYLCLCYVPLINASFVVSSNISRKVSKLMDSFRPGSSSYCPFQNQDQDQSIIVNRIDNAREANADQIQTVDTVPDNITDSEDDRESTESSDENREEENRRQLYLPSGRPRPFYRVYSTSPQTSLLEDAGTITQSRIPSSNNKVALSSLHIFAFSCNLEYFIRE